MLTLLKILHRISRNFDGKPIYINPSTSRYVYVKNDLEGIGIPTVGHEGSILCFFLTICNSSTPDTIQQA